jgi:hypothetical protein
MKSVRGTYRTIDLEPEQDSTPFLLDWEEKGNKGRRLSISLVANAQSN